MLTHCRQCMAPQHYRRRLCELCYWRSYARARAGRERRRQRQQTCRHCHERPVSRPRGLCWRCYHTPGVRELYPPTSKFTRRGAGVTVGNCRTVPLPEPTVARPGTPEKVAVLEGRAGRGEQLFHPLDATPAAAGVA